MSMPPIDPNKGWVRLNRPAGKSVLDFGNPPDLATTPRTEMTVQLTVSSLAHPDDVAAVIERLQAAIKDAAAVTGGRLDIQFALPEIVREEFPAAIAPEVTSSAP